MHIAVLEDEADWARHIAAAFALAGWQGRFFTQGEALLDATYAESFDAILLDVHLTGSALNGVDVLARLRARQSREPVLMLTQFAARHRAAAALDVGADDYLAKPFDADELCARVRAIHRRIAATDAQMVRAGPLRLSHQYRCAHWFDRRIALRGQGFDILAMLVEAGGDVVTQDALWNRVWAKWTSLGMQLQPIQAAVSRLRKDIREVTGFEVVVTVPGIGYRLALAD